MYECYFSILYDLDYDIIPIARTKENKHNVNLPADKPIHVAKNS